MYNRCKISFDTELWNSTYKDTPLFYPSLTYGKVLKVYDGDTVTVAARVHGGLYKWSIRIRGIDTPEMNSSDGVEKHKAQLAQQALQQRLMPFSVGKIVYFEDVKYDKYGRILATLYHDGENIGNWLIGEGHAKEYNGGSKT